MDLDEKGIKEVKQEQITAAKDESKMAWMKHDGLRPVHTKPMMAVAKAGLEQGMVRRLVKDVGPMTSGTYVIIKEITKSGMQCYEHGGDENKTELVPFKLLQELSTEKTKAPPKFDPST